MFTTMFSGSVVAVTGILNVYLNAYLSFVIFSVTSPTLIGNKRRLLSLSYGPAVFPVGVGMRSVKGPTSSTPWNSNKLLCAELKSPPPSSKILQFSWPSVLVGSRLVTPGKSWISKRWILHWHPAPLVSFLLIGTALWIFAVAREVVPSNKLIFNGCRLMSPFPNNQSAANSLRFDLVIK